MLCLENATKKLEINMLKPFLTLDEFTICCIMSYYAVLILYGLWLLSGGIMKAG